MALKEKLIDKAQKLIQKGALDKAVNEYRSALELDPKDISIRLRIGDLYVKTGKKPDAIREYNEAARANAQRGFYLKAIAVYKQILKLEDSFEVHNKLAELYTKQRLIADAIGEYSYLVSYFEKRGKTNEVLELLKKMVDIDPENIGVRLKLAELYQKLSFDKDSLLEYFLIFDRLLAQGKLDTAEKIFSGLYNAYPAEEKILAGFCEIYRLKKDTIQQTRFLKSLFNLYCGSERADDAARVAGEILKVKPGDIEATKFLKKSSKEEEKAPVAAEPEPIAEAPVEAIEAEVSQEPSVISWAEEEIEVSIEGFEEDAGLEAAQDAGVPAGTAPAEEEPKPSQPAAAVPQQPLPDEIEIEIEDLVNGEVPEAKAAVEAETPPETAPEIEIELELPAEEAIEPVQEALPEKTEGFETAPAEAAPEEQALEIEAEAVSEAPVPAVEVPALEEPVFEKQDPVLEESASAVEDRAEPVVEEIVIEPEIEAFETAAYAAETPSVDQVSASGAAPVPVETLKTIEEAQTPQSLETPSEAVSIAEEESQEDLSSAFQELMEKIEPDSPAAESGDGSEAKSPAEDYVDLSAELGMEEATKDLAGSWGGKEPQETFDEFKSGIGNQLNKEDSETHYNLGIAYMEMELFSEASKEFKIALKDPRLEFDCYSRLGLCSMASGEPAEAVVYYSKGLNVDDRSIEERIGMMYELGLAFEADGNTEEANEIFKGIHDLAPSFREVASKVTESIYERPMIPYDDNLIEVELL